MNCEQHKAPKEWGAGFENRAKQHRNAAMVWAVLLLLVATVVGGGVTWAGLFMQWSVPPAPVLTPALISEGESKKQPLHDSSSTEEKRSAVNAKKSPERAEDLSATPASSAHGDGRATVHDSSPTEEKHSAVNAEKSPERAEDLSATPASSAHGDGWAAVNQHLYLAWASFFQNTLNRWVLFLLLAFVLLFFVKNCLAHSHNQIVNHHRANALSVCQQLVCETQDKESIRFILHQAATCVWKVEESGFFIRRAKNIKGDEFPRQVIDQAVNR